MPRRSFSRGRRRFSKPVKRAETAWLSFETSPTNVPGEPGSILLAPGQGINEWLISPNDSEVFFDEPVLLRSLIGYSVATIDPVADHDGETILYMGVIVTPGDAVSPPTIFPTVGSHDWIWHGRVLLGRNPGGGSTGGTFFAAAATDAAPIFDIRSKRRIPNGYGLAFYADAVASPTGSLHPEVGVYWWSRMLFKN